MSDPVRADKWLWATRFFKTRNLAADSCSLGKVKRNGHVLKPASTVHVGDLLEIPFIEGPGHRTVLVSALIDVRVGAPEAGVCYVDRTEESVFEALRAWRQARREAPAGRPTKKDRREIDRIHGFLDGI